MKKCLTLPIALSIVLLGSAAAQEPFLGRTSFGPGDPVDTLLTMPSAGRVSLSVSSSSGVPISLQDRMVGLLARSGSAGEYDGRIDITLDQGEYRVRIEAQDSAGKAIGLAARSFRETNGDTASAWPLLIPGEVVQTGLQDLQSSSYWVELREDGPLEVEALGRDLAALEIWREGQYLVKSYIPVEERTVEKGKPMGWIGASLRGKAGLYLVKAYGGQARAWSGDNPEHPLFIRSGFIRLPIGGRLELAISPFGRDFILADGVDRAVMTLGAKGEGSLSAQAYSPGSERRAASGGATVTPSTISRSCAVGVPSKGSALIAVGGTPGAIAFLDVNTSAEMTRIPASDLAKGGLLVVSAPRSAAPELEATGLVYRLRLSASGRRAVVAKDFCAPLSGQNSIRRRLNVGPDGELSLYIRVEDAGSYRIAEKSGTGQASALYRMELLDPNLSDPGRAKAVPAKQASFELTRGYYRLSLSAASVGVLDFLLYKSGFGRGVGSDLDKDPPILRDSFAWAFDPDSSATDLYVLLGSGPSAGTGLSFSAFPLPLDAGLRLELGPKEELALPCVTAVPGRFRWVAHEGSVLVDGREPAEGRLVAPGGQRLTIRNGGSGPAMPAFALEPSYDDLPPPLPSAFGQGMAGLAMAAPKWRDFGRQESVTYSLVVGEPAVYAIETLGRLATSLVVRTPVSTRLFEASANGYGRNASIRVWLKPGRYYVEAATQGQSRGRAGLRAERVPLLADLSLPPGAVDRRTVPADAAIRFGLELGAESLLSFHSVGLSRAFPVRLEDGEGFVLYSGSGKGSLRLPKGRYSLYSLPVSIDTNRLTWVEAGPAPILEPPIPGTRELGLNASASAVWKGDPSGDRYSFAIPADLPRVVITLPPEFSASLSGPGGTRDLSPEARAGLELKRGIYQLTVRPRDKANELPYTIGVSTDILAPGLSLRVAVDQAASARLSVPEDGFYELWSLGQVDVSARLVSEASGESVASADDNGPDWNIDIVQRLKAGLYRLELGSIPGSSGDVELSLVSRNAKSLPPAVAPYGERLSIDGSGVLLPFDTQAEEGLYLVSADSGAPVSFRLYRGDRLLAVGEGRLAIPLRKAVRYSLYAWTPFAADVGLSVKRLGESDQALAAPFSLAAGSVVRLRNDAALSARVTAGELVVSPGAELPCIDPGAAPFSTLPEGGWAWAPESAARVEPLALREGEGAVLSLGATDQGFTLSSGSQAVLIMADTGGQFRCGISALPAAGAGGAPYDWDASSAWSRGSVALLPPGGWKGRVWDGERASGLVRRIGVGAKFLELTQLSPLVPGARDSLTVPPGAAIAMELPECTLSLLLGEGLVVSAWKGGEALATRTALDGRATETLSVPACKLLVANNGTREASLRLAVLPARPATELELSAARPFEAVDLPPEGIRLDLKAGRQELLCLGGDAAEAILETEDGRYLELKHDPAGGLFTSVAASSGSILVRSEGGLVRAWLAKAGSELEGLVARDRGAARRELKDAALLSGKGDAFRFSLGSAGYVDISCPGPGVLELVQAGPGGGSSGVPTPRVAISGSRDEMRLFAWLSAGDYELWQRPARGVPGGGILRMDRIESRKADPADLARQVFIAAGEYQAWSFSVAATGLVGVGIKADADGLQGFLYDSKQGLIAKGALAFAQLESGEYLFVVKGLDRAPMEYDLVLDGTEGSRLGVPPDVLDSYKARTAQASSVLVPLRERRLDAGGGEGPSSEMGAEDSGDEGDYGDAIDEGDGSEQGLDNYGE